ncbi:MULTISPECIES: helix-turn-helix domain-containing protein [Bacillus]|nr:MULTISPECIES: helix-turn-helix transcriptional regulator [Bacillus]AMM96316.1 XRE family transcriptional regulator [Bacillus pumilus]MBU8576667.1 helix-turn-helix domain-containing protein [Bacillus pumilus]MCY9672009.1 helix-turn-helix domain-containing protein [Bacillus pumilus]MDH3150318.1 helix-turn-helix transcriptional regulator [Bacillus pumilus]
MTLGERLKFVRAQKKWSQEYAAEKIGISKAVLSNYERNYRDPDTNTLKKISEIYNVSTDFLLGRDEDEDISDPVLSAAFKEAIEELKDEDTLLLMKSGNIDAETATLIKKALKNGIRLVDEMKKKE